MRRYSIKTKNNYVRWVVGLIRFNATRRPQEMGGSEVTAFLNHLANARQVSASTKSQALTLLPKSLVVALSAQMEKVKTMHDSRRVILGRSRHHPDRRAR